MVAAPSIASLTDTVPRLHNGDRLNRFEFERRYEADPDVRHAELIEGVVYLSSPVRFTQHAEPNFHIAGWLAVYCASASGTVAGGDKATVRLDLDNDPQPDALLRYVVNGTSRLVLGYIEGPPKLVVEGAASSTAIDMHGKKNACRRNGVREYIV